MRYTTLLLLALLLGSKAMTAQSATTPDTTLVNEASLDALRPPGEPAFSILGVQPTEISRPKSMKALESTLANSFFDGNKIILPKNFAFEMNPYLAFKSDSMKIDTADFFNGSRKPADIFWHNLSFSAATGQFPSYLDTSLQNTRMGLGARTQISWLKSTKGSKDAFNDLQKKKRILADKQHVISLFNTLLNSRVFREINDTVAAKVLIDEANNWLAKVKSTRTPEIGKLLDDFWAYEVKLLGGAQTAGDVKEMMRAHVANMDDFLDIKTTAKQVQDRIDDKSGLTLEIATASLLDFPTDDIAYSRMSKWAVWSTLSYRSPGQVFEAAVLGRYTKTMLDTSAHTNSLDGGGRLTIENKQWSVSGEYIQRVQWKILSSETVGNQTTTVTYRNYDFRASLNVNYKLTDNIIINYTFGNNFTVGTETLPDNSLMSTLGLVYALGGPTVKNLGSKSK